MASRTGGGKPANKVEVEPASATRPRSRTTKAQVAAAVEQSAQFLEEQAAAPKDVHPKPTTPAKAEVEEAVQQSAQFLRTQEVGTDAPPTQGRDKTSDASPVAAGGLDAGLAASPVYAGRDKSADAAPVSTAPITDTPSD